MPATTMSDHERAVNVAARLKRDIAIRRTAQVLADALAARGGAELVGLSQMSADDRDWHLKATRSLIDIYEAAMGIESPTAAKPAPVIPEPCSQATALILRQQGRDAAHERSHDMGIYQTLADGRQMATCRKCARAVVLNLSADAPSISGSAINEGCLTEAGKDGE